MDAADMTQLLEQTRKKLELERGTAPRVVQLLERPEEQLHAIVPDRAEKSQCIGPGGMIVAEVAKKLGKDLAFLGEDELALRRARLESSKTRIDEIRESEDFNDSLLSALNDLIDKEVAYPAASWLDYRPKRKRGNVAVSYSGGVDSSATLAILRKLQIDCDAYTVSPNPRILCSSELDTIKEICRELGASCHILENPRITQDVIKRAQDGRIHPCGECHTAIMQTVIQESKSDGHRIIVTGQSLPTGRQALQKKEGTLLIHLPALLCLTKYRMKQILKQQNISTGQNMFGCRFLSNLHSRGWGMAGPSVYRVLRELEAGVLTSREAWRFIKMIVKPAMTK